MREIAADPVTDSPPRDLLLAIANDVGFPAVSYGDLRLAGSTSWRDVVGRAGAPIERLDLLRSLHRHLLVASPHGRARLRAWLDKERLAPRTALPSWLERRWLDERLAYYGDPPMLGLVVEGLIRLPAPVRAAVVSECIIIAVGYTATGWTSSARFVDRDEQTKPRAIVLSGHGDDKAVVRRVCHESAHAWHAPPPRVWSQALTARSDERVRTLAITEGWLGGRAQEHFDSEERRAQALELIWSSSSTSGASAQILGAAGDFRVEP